MKFVGSSTGKKLITLSLPTIGLSALLYNAIPYTVLLDKYQELYQLYKDKCAVPVPENIERLFQEVVTDLEGQLAMKYVVKPFMTSEFDIFNAGATYNRQGAIIGIPATFAYNSLEDVDQNKIMVGSRSVEWGTKTGERLKYSLVLSDKAKKFAIAHEVLMSNTYQMWLKDFYPPLILFLAMKFSELYKEKFKLHLQPPVFRGAVYSVIGLFGYIVWCLVYDRTNITYEMRTTKKLSEMGSDYVEGGIEYYSKVLERNKALRDLLPEGSSLFTVTGNKHALLRFPTVPLTARKQILQESHS